MEIKTKTRTAQILAVMRILTILAFIGYIVNVGAILFSFVASCANPEAAKNLYQGLDLYNLRQLNFLYYTAVVSFMIALAAMKAFVWYLVFHILSHINLTNPFKIEVVQMLEKISYVLFGTWIVGMVSSAYARWLMKITGELYGNWATEEFIFMAGLVFIISQIFKRGVEIQSENELTV